MTDFSRKFAASSSDSASWNDSSITQIIDIDLETNGYEGVHVVLDAVSSSTVDDITILCYSSLDGSNFDDIAFCSFSISNPGTTADQIGFILKDWLRVRISGQTAGNDTITVSASHQCWEWTDA